MLELGDDLNARANGLGADAKQKISLGRGLVRRTWRRSCSTSR